jgi:hypothetical protein
MQWLFCQGYLTWIVEKSFTVFQSIRNFSINPQFFDQSAIFRSIRNFSINPQFFDQSAIFRSIRNFSFSDICVYTFYCIQQAFTLVLILDGIKKRKYVSNFEATYIGSKMPILIDFFRLCIFSEKRSPPGSVTRWVSEKNCPKCSPTRLFAKVNA